MDRLVHRDAAALRQLYDRHSPLVLALARKMLGSVADADALVADVFVELWQKPERYDAGRSSPRSYILLLTRSRALDRLRSRKAERAVSIHDQPIQLQDNSPDPADPIEKQETAVAVRSALAKLSEDERKLVGFSFFYGLSHSEIAQQLSMPLGTVKTRIRNALIRLRSELRTYRNETEGARGTTP